MSILIKGIDLPKEGEHIDLRIWSDGIVAPFKGNTYTQAIQIDRPHGRLIDGDEIATILDARTSGKACLLTKEMPTIIEAEE